MVTLPRNLHDQILLWHLEIAAIVGINTCIVSDQAKVVGETNTRKVVHLNALVRLLAHFIDRSHLSIVPGYPATVVLAFEKVGRLNISVSEQPLRVFITFQIIVTSRG